MGNTKRTAFIIALMMTGGAAIGGKNLEGIACRSVHLAYKAPQSTVFYNEMTVEQSAEGSYFMACGFRMGYFGIQEQRNGRKVVIFSVWDPGSQNDPKSVPEDRQVRVLHHDPDVLVKRFGGEGTGGQSFFEYDWETGKRYKFMIKAKPSEDRTAFSGFFYLPESDTWKHLVTFETISGGVPLESYNSFVEDFRRNRISTTHTRRARFGNGWIRDMQGDWRELTTARFTADANPVLNINAGLNAGDFYLTTGGDITNKNTPLWGYMTRPASTNGAPDETLEIMSTPSKRDGLILRSDDSAKEDMPVVKVNVDASQVPELEDWAQNAADLIRQYDSAISKRLRVAGFTPPRTVNLIVDKNMKGVAGTSGTTIRLAAAWLRSHPDDWGMVIHEYTHVVQSYPKYDPPWLVEGIADYIRFFMFEPHENRPRPNFKHANYDDGYRTTAAFLAWIEKTHAPNIIERLNSALRKTTYDEALFKTLTGHNIDFLWREFSNTTP